MAATRTKTRGSTGKSSGGYPSSGDRRHDGQGASRPVPHYYLARVPICQPDERIAYLPSFGGSAVDIDELVPGDVEEVDGLGDEGDGGGGVVDVDDFGVTTGGVLGAVDVLVSR